MPVVTPSPSPPRVSLVRKYGNFVTTPNCPCTRCKIIRRKKLDDKWWAFWKKIPGVKVVYGVIRGYSKWYDGDSEEAWKSIATALGGVAEIAFFACFGVYTLGGPFGYVICATLPGNLVGGGLESLVKYCYWEPSEEGEEFSMEEVIYENVLRDIAFVGGVYSAATAGYAAYNGDRETAKERGINAGINLVASSVAYGVAKGLSSGASSKPALNCECAPSPSANILPDNGVTAKVINVAKTAKDAIIDQAKGSTIADLTTAETAVSTTVRKLTFVGKCAKRAAPNLSKAVIDPLLTLTVNNLMHQPAPVMRETVAAVLYRNCPSALALIGIQESKYKYITRCILHCLFGLVSQGTGDPLDELDIKQLANKLLQTGDAQVVQAVLLWLPFGAPASASYSEVDQAEIIEGDKRRALTMYLVQKMHPGFTNVPFPEILKDDKNLKQFECPKGQVKYQPARDNNGEIKVRGPSGLCLDGGGICGLNSLEILALFESELVKQGQARGQGQGQSSLGLDKSFDFYVGTSVGAIICVALLLGYSIMEIKKLVYKLKDQVFSGSKPHDGQKLESIFKEYFGEKLTLADVGRQQGAQLVIPVARTDVTPFELNFYTNVESDATKNEKVWKVLRRATAAPSFFLGPQEPPGQPQHLDGGLMANNATKAFITYLRTKTTQEPGFILSVGTGKFKREPTSLFPNIHGNVVFDGLKAKRIITTFATQLTEADGHVVEDHADLCGYSGCSYYRLTPTLSENIELNETDDLKLLKMMYQTKVYVHENRGKIKKIVTDMIKFKVRRSRVDQVAHNSRTISNPPNHRTEHRHHQHQYQEESDSDGEYNEHDEEEETVTSVQLRHRKSAVS